MKLPIPSLLPAFAMLAAPILHAEVPETIHYQGKVSVNGEPFDGTGQFKFALVDDGTENVVTAQAEAVLNNGFVTSIVVIDGGSGYEVAPAVNISGGGGSGAQATASITDGTVTGITVNQAGSGYTSQPTVTLDAPPPATIQTLWSHDGTSTAGSEPNGVVLLPVNQGVFSVNLGDIAFDGMSETITPQVLTAGPGFLRVWFDDGSGTFQQLTPDQTLASVPYALVAETVREGAISTGQIDSGFALWSKDEATDSVFYYPSDFGGIRITPYSDPAGNIPESDWSPNITIGHVDNEAIGRGITISGGGAEAGPHIALGSFSTIGGGFGNMTEEWHATVAGGRWNTASDFASAIGGGTNNVASGVISTVAGGADNSASGTSSNIGGGSNNEASGSSSTVAGGRSNLASGNDSTVAGGFSNTASGLRASVAGGGANLASGNSATVAGGVANEAIGDYSFAAGRQAKANHDGAFVWADSTAADFASTNPNQFLIRADGGVGIGTTNPTAQLNVRASTGKIPFRVQVDNNSRLIVGDNGGTSLGDFNNTPPSRGLYVFGRTGIRTPSPQDALHVKGQSSAALILENANDVNGWGIGTGTSSGNFNFYYNENVTPFSLTGTRMGGINRTTGEYDANSDERLKSEIESMEGVLDDVLALRPTSYRFKRGSDADPRSIGFIAQEVREIFPELVHDHGEDGYLSLVYSNFGVLAIRAIQEQQELIDAKAGRIEAQQARIDALESKLADLEKLESRLSLLESAMDGGTELATVDSETR